MASEHSVRFERTLAADSALPDGPTVQVYSVRGPGMPAYANEFVVWREHDAQRIQLLIAAAFDAGKLARSAELRELLGTRGP